MLSRSFYLIRIFFLSDCNSDEKIFPVPKVQELVQLYSLDKELIWIAGFVALFMALTVLTVLITFGSRFYQQRKTKRYIRNRELYHKKLSKFLLQDEKEIPGLFRRLRTKKAKQFLLNEIVTMHRMVKGEVANRLHMLYYSLALFHLTNQKLRSRKKSQLVSGITEAAEMGLHAALPFIRPCIHHKRAVVREEAIVAMAKLERPVSLDFLADYPFELSEWTQVRLQIVFQGLSNREHVPSFADLLYVNNSGIVRFALKMIAYYREFDAEERVTDLLEHPEEEVRKNAIKAVGQISNGKAAEVLTCQLSEETVGNRLEILKSLKVHASQIYRKPFKQLLKTEKNYEIMLHAAQLLYISGKKGKKNVKKVLKNKRPEYRSIYKYLKKNVES